MAITILVTAPVNHGCDTLVIKVLAVTPGLHNNRTSQLSDTLVIAGDAVTRDNRSRLRDQQDDN